MVFAHNDNPMQIEKTWFKPFTKHEKQCWCVNNLCLYCGELRHIIGGCQNKRFQYVAHATTFTSIQGIEEKGSENIQF